MNRYGSNSKFIDLVCHESHITRMLTFLKIYLCNWILWFNYFWLSYVWIFTLGKIWFWVYKFKKKSIPNLFWFLRKYCTVITWTLTHIFGKKYTARKMKNDFTNNYFFSHKGIVTAFQILKICGFAQRCLSVYWCVSQSIIFLNNFHCIDTIINHKLITKKTKLWF